jgi:hypothetical protein
LTKDSAEACLTIAEAAWFFRYPMAINTWKLYVLMHPFTCLPQCITSKCRHRKQGGRHHKIVGTAGRTSSATTSYSQNKNDTHTTATTTRTTTVPCMEEMFIGDNVAGFHRKSFLDFVEADKYPIDMAFVQVHNSVEVSPYCICVDHVWKTIVVCIRGSLSLEDYAIHIMVDREPMEEVGERYGFDGKGEHCHKGFLERAKWVCEDIDRWVGFYPLCHGDCSSLGWIALICCLPYLTLPCMLSLNYIFYRQGVLAQLIGGDSALFPSYSLHVVGHSLGAAVASLVAIMLRPRFTELRCLCFGTPGAMVSKGLAVRCREFLTTFVAGNDLVPSLSVDNVELLRNDLIKLVARTKVPKYVACRQSWLHKNSSDDKIDEVIGELLYDENDIPDSECKRQIEEFLRHQETRQRDRGLPRIPLYPPGRVVHAVERKTNTSNTSSSCCGSMVVDCAKSVCNNCCHKKPEKQYSATWAENDDFNEILVTDDMMNHHFPNAYQEFFQGMAKKLGVDYTSRPE